jgi:hypothetical protein
VPDIDARQGSTPRSSEESDRVDRFADRAHLEQLIYSVLKNGHLGALIAQACEAGEDYFPPTYADPGYPIHPGVQAAIRAYKSWKEAEGMAMATDVQRSQDADSSKIEPEIVPLSAVGRWVAWSSDGLRILAIADTIEEAERKAAEEGETEPILEVPPAPHRL